MTQGRFSQPVEVVLGDTAGDGHVAMIDNPRDAMRAMNDGLGHFALDVPAWQLTFMTLGQAVIDPTPEKLESARDAFERLARATSPAPDRAELAP